MSSPETMDQRPIGERRRRRLAESAAADPAPQPMTRREMRAQGIPLTTEVPAVEEPPDWPMRSGVAAAADRSVAARAGARRALSATEETATGEFRALPAPTTAPATGIVPALTLPEPPAPEPPAPEPPAPEAPEALESEQQSVAPDAPASREPDEAGPPGDRGSEETSPEAPAGSVEVPARDAGRRLSRRELRALGLASTELAPVPEPPPPAAEVSRPAEEPTEEPAEELSGAGETAPAQAAEPAPAGSGAGSEAEGRVEPGEAAPLPVVPVPSRRALREKRPDRPSSAAEGSAVEAGPRAVETTAERTSTGRRPVVRTPVTARGVRTVDESGAITGVQPAAPASGPGGWAPSRHPSAPPQPHMPHGPDWSDSPSSWESAVTLPAVVMGIEDSPEPPTGERERIKASKAKAKARKATERAAARSAEAGAGPAAAQPGPAQASPSRQSLRAVAREADGGKGGASASAGEATQAWPAPEPLRSSAEASPRRSRRAEGAGPERRTRAEARRVEGEEPEGAEERLEGVTASGPLRVILLVAVGLAIGALIYLIASGALGSLFAAGPTGTVDRGAAVGALLLALPRAGFFRTDRGVR